MFKKTRRLTGGVLIAAVAVLAVLANAEAEAQLTKVRVSTIPILDTAPLQVGIAKGFFAEQGLEVDTTPTAGGAAGLPALAAGQVQITFSNIVSIVLGAKQGLEFEIISGGSATGATAPDVAAMVTKKGSSLKTGKDLEVKRIAVNTRNNIIWLYARAWVLATGGNPDRVTYVEVPFPQMVDAVRGDQVDAAFVVDPFLAAGVKSGAVEIIAWPYNTVQKRVPVAQYAATKSFIQANPALIERWVRGYNKAVDWTTQNKGSEEWLKIISGYTRLSPDQLRDISLPVYDKTVDSAAIEQVVALMRKNGMVEGNVNVKGMLYKTASEGVK
jgi:NitT/TauT family transport system substrate-binding protein